MNCYRNVPKQTNKPVQYQTKNSHHPLPILLLFLPLSAMARGS